MGLRVINPGLATTVQDQGRPGYREWGVPIAGAFDRGSAALANALLANPPAAAVLEMTLFGGTYEAESPLALALAGAPMQASIAEREGRETRLTVPCSFPLRPGERLIVNAAPIGARCYLAVRGGWRTPLVLGSRSSETRLKAGDVLDAEPGTTRARHLAPDELSGGSVEAIRFIEGPDAEFVRLDALETGTFRVGGRSNRMGLRLEGDPLDVRPEPERISTPVAPGALQVAGGQVIVLGIACGTMGGYPHVAHVITADLDRLGQLRPGEAVRFRRVTIDEARRLDRDDRARRAKRLQGIATAVGDGDLNFPEWR